MPLPCCSSLSCKKSRFLLLSEGLGGCAEGTTLVLLMCISLCSVPPRAATLWSWTPLRPTCILQEPWPSECWPLRYCCLIIKAVLVDVQQRDRELLLQSASRLSTCGFNRLERGGHLVPCHKRQGNNLCHEPAVPPRVGHGTEFAAVVLWPQRLWELCAPGHDSYSHYSCISASWLLWLMCSNSAFALRISV